MAHRQDGFCCTSISVGNFGEGDECTNYRSCLNLLKQAIRWAEDNGHAMVTCHSTKCQKPLNKALRDLGFRRTRFFSKRKFCKTQVALWHLPILKEYRK